MPDLPGQKKHTNEKAPQTTSGTKDDIPESLEARAMMLYGLLNRVEKRMERLVDPTNSSELGVSSHLNKEEFKHINVYKCSVEHCSWMLPNHDKNHSTMCATHVNVPLTRGSTSMDHFRSDREFYNFLKRADIDLEEAQRRGVFKKAESN